MFQQNVCYMNNNIVFTKEKNVVFSNITFCCLSSFLIQNSHTNIGT